MHALIVSPHFPPRRRVGALRAYRWARHLPSHGIVPHVVCLDAGSEPTTDERAILDRIDTLRLAAPFDRSATRSSSSLERQSGDGTSLVDTVDRGFPVDTFAPLLVAQLPRVLWFARMRRVDAVVATADPWSSLVLGRLVARTLDVPFVADFRDPWTLCAVRGRDRPQLTRRVDRRVEADVVSGAAAIMFTAERARARYACAYEDAAARMHVLHNGFEGGTVVVSPPARPARTQLSLLFFGVFRPLAPARALVDALARLVERRPGAAPRLRIESMGGLDAEDAAYAEARGVRSLFVTVPSVHPVQAFARQSQADALLVVANPERTDMIPAKLFEALPVGRPVLGFGTGPDVERILQRTGVGAAARDPGHGAELLEALIDARAGGGSPSPFGPVDPVAIAGLHVHAQVATLARLLRAVIA